MYNEIEQKAFELRDVLQGSEWEDEADTLWELISEANIFSSKDHHSLPDVVQAIEDARKMGKLHELAQDVEKYIL